MEVSMFAESLVFAARKCKAWTMVRWDATHWALCVMGALASASLTLFAFAALCGVR